MHASTARRRVLFPVFVLLLSMSLAAAPVASSAPSTPTNADAATPASPVSLDTGPLAVPTDGTLEFHVKVDVDTPTSYLEVRLQVRRPSGRLLYQKTEIRHDLATGTVDVAYKRSLADLDLAVDAYPVEVRVRSDSGEVREWNLEDRLLVFDPKRPAVPVVLVAALDSPPIFDPQGRAATDPSMSDAARRQTEELCHLVLGEESARITLAAPPLILEEWARVADGYDLAAPEGVVNVPADSPTSLLYAGTLELLKTAIGTGRLELMSVPYAQPDLEGLQSMDRMSDLTQHYERGLSSSLTTLETTPSAGTMLSSAALSSDALASIGGRGLAYAVTTTASVEPRDDLLPGVHAIERSNLRILLIDSSASDLLGSEDQRDFAGVVFDRYLSEKSTHPLVALVHLGPGPSRTSDLARAAAAMGSVAWAHPVSGTEAASADPDTTVQILGTPDSGPDAPGEFWADVRSARSYAQALVAALGAQDADANSAVDASLVAESRCWAGVDGSWSLADRGRAYAAAAERSGESVLRSVSLSAKDITLSSARGDIPIVITNDAERGIAVTLRAKPVGLELNSETSRIVSLRPSDNFLTVPVDLKSALSGRLELELWAGDIQLDAATVTVRASYLDRLAIVAGLALVLVGVLLFIRRRVLSANGTNEARDGRGSHSNGGAA